MNRDLVLNEGLQSQQQHSVLSSLAKLSRIFYSYHVTSKLGESTLVAHSPLHVTQAWRDKRQSVGQCAGPHSHNCRYLQDTLGSLHYGTVKHTYKFLRTDDTPFHIHNQYSNKQFAKCTRSETDVGV
jgi:hypothetical protein